jgi:hypothetical protein
MTGVPDVALVLKVALSNVYAIGMQVILFIAGD